MLDPLRIGQRAAGLDGDVLAVDVDLAGLLPVPADGLIVQPRGTALGSVSPAVLYRPQVQAVPGDVLPLEA
jgi:hypothetical protein